MKHQKLIFAILAFSALGVIFLYMAGIFEPKVEKSEVEKIEVSNIQTYQLTPTISPIIHQYVGSVVATQQATLTARITAQISQVLISVGQEVKAGDLLMRLDNQDLSASVRQSEQAIIAAQAQVNLARNENARIEALYKKRLVAKRELDAAQTTLKSSQAELKRLQAGLGQAQATLGYSLIVAPFDGIITSKFVNLGDTATPAQPLLTLYNPHSLQFEVAVSASDRAKLALNQAAPLGIEGIETTIEERITEIAPSINRGSQSLMVKFSLASTLDLYPGVFGRLYLTVGQQEILEVAVQDIIRVGQLEYVQLVDDGQLQRHLIQTQTSSNKDKRIVIKGLKKGDIIARNTLLDN